MPAYEAIAEKFDEALELLREIAPNQSVNDLESEDEAFVCTSLRKLMRAMNVLQSYTDFDWEVLMSKKTTKQVLRLTKK
jgi:type I restriction enzyme R subunit